MNESNRNLTIIKSARDGTALEFSDRDRDFFRVSIRGAEIYATARVYSFEPRSCQLADFFRDLAVHWQGWHGRKEWASLEGELALAATSDSTGHTSLVVELRSNDYPLGWNLSATLLIEAGQWEQIASDMKRFFRDARPA